jgi:hypothetical protein
VNPSPGQLKSSLDSSISEYEIIEITKKATQTVELKL